jgi:DNA-binding transcriptional regulator LsrR (DeoR family)
LEQRASQPDFWNDPATSQAVMRELTELRALGAIGDTNGLFFDSQGKAVDHPLNLRTIALGLEELRRISTVALVAGSRKLEATRGFLSSGIASGLIIDGDTAIELAGSS